MEREKPTSLLLEKQREALVKGAEASPERRDECAPAEAEAATPRVGRWGAEWPS